jgi:hypothetical protein
MGTGLGLMGMSGPVKPQEGWRVILHGNNGRTWFSGFAPPPLLLSLPLLATQIKMGSGFPEMECVREEMETARRRPSGGAAYSQQARDNGPMNI